MHVNYTSKLRVDVVQTCKMRNMYKLVCESCSISIYITNILIGSFGASRF